MNPNQQQNNNNQVPQQPNQAPPQLNNTNIQQQATPQQPMPPQSQYQQQNQYGGGASNKKNNMLALFIAGSALLLLVAGIVFLYLFIFSDDAQAKRASTEFMNAACAGDADALIDITDEKEEDSQDFLRNVASSLEGECSLSEQAEEENVWYFLYTIENASANYARTSVEKDSASGWAVSSIYFSESELRLIPGGGEDIDSSAEATEEVENDEPAPAASAPDQSTTTLGACLINGDYRYMNFDKSIPSVQYDATYEPDDGTFNYKGYMFFKPDSSNEDSLPSLYDDWAEFAKENSDKQWVFRLRGSVYGQDQVSPASVTLASQRSEAVRSELIARGVPEDRIVIIEPNQYLNETQDDSLKEIYRRVEVIVDPTCVQSGQR